jgi:hypothetical protein
VNKPINARRTDSSTSKPSKTEMGETLTKGRSRTREGQAPATKSLWGRAPGIERVAIY